MAINPNSRKFTHGLDQRRVKAIRYFTILLIISVPVAFAYQGIKNIKPKKDETLSVKVETGDRPVEKTVNITIKADGGLNFRKEAKKDAEKIGKIPDGTKLVVKKEIDGWYQVDFEGKEGWVAKEFTITDEAKKQAVESDATKDWLVFDGKAYGMSLKYPTGWSAADYGKQPDEDSVIGFSFSQLPPTMQAGFFIPLDIRVSVKARESLEAPLKAIAQKTVTEIDIAGVKGAKYVYTDNIDSTEKSKIIFTKGANNFIISENGGYGVELDEIIKTLKVN